ncbi:Flap endonuclease [Thalictrum thalictroides]|uniref:Flap endonuclease 1 n=1 Tax=Thalictrum thalictroides TaxID=46969 RepID=A0A7J6WLL5_THATH|nr:Flap endonuclease [Thalictrum thalictroides]
MGIKGLTKLLAANAPNSMKETTFESYSGREIAVDASTSIYQFLIVVGRNGTQMLTNDAGQVTSHLQGLFSRTIRLLEAGMKPVYVFDGKPPDLKKQELAKRHSKRMDASEYLAAAIESGVKEDIEKYSKRTVKVTRQHNEDCKKLLRLMGVPVVEASSEAEAECATLCKTGKVYAVASEDMDTLTFGAPIFVRHLMGSSRKFPVVQYEVAKILKELNLTMDQFIDLCILCGCDYCDGIRGIGGQTALKLVRQHGSIENIVEKISKVRYRIPENWPFQEARCIFKDPVVSVSDQNHVFEWITPDEEVLKNFLVNENGFNHDRVTKAIGKIKAANYRSSNRRLHSLKPWLRTSVPLKSKETKCQLGVPSAFLNPKMFSLQVYMHLRPKLLWPSVDELVRPVNLFLGVCKELALFSSYIHVSSSWSIFFLLFPFQALLLLYLMGLQAFFDMDAIGRLNKTKYECLLFDMDDTLYPMSTGINYACRKNIEEYMLQFLEIDASEVPRMCLELYKEYGTTMAGLKALGYGFDNDEFHAFVHGRLPYERLKPDPVLRNLLLSMPQRKIIFTNADKAHADQVLSRLGLDDCFEGIICFETLNPPFEPNSYEDEVYKCLSSEEPDYNLLFSDSERKADAIYDENDDSLLPKSQILCKPSLESMEAAIQIANVDPKKTIFFDDSVRNIASGKAAGLHTVIVGSSELVPGADLALTSIHNIKEALPEIWEEEEDQFEQVVQSTAVETVDVLA